MNAVYEDNSSSNSNVHGSKIEWYIIKTVMSVIITMAVKLWEKRHKILNYDWKQT